MACKEDGMINETIYTYLTGLSLPEMAVYDGQKAIFEQQAPEDTDSLWEGIQYGRVIYSLQMKEDAERKVSGLLRVMTAYTGAGLLQEAENILKSSFEQTFFSEENLSIATSWQKTESFTEKINNETDTDVFGSILYFDVYAFPKKKYVPMDAVNSLAAFIADRYPDAWNINDGDAEGVWQPGNGTQGTAFYVRLSTIAPGSFPSIYACTWHQATLWVHVVSASYDEANAFILDIQHALMEKERFRMNDGSPFFVGNVQSYQGNHVLRDGQMKITGQYGVLREIEDGYRMNHIDVTKKKEG